jgi:hypothetical protein
LSSIGAGGWVEGLSPGQSRDENVEMAEDISQVKDTSIVQGFHIFCVPNVKKNLKNLTDFALIGTENLRLFVRNSYFSSVP